MLQQSPLEPMQVDAAPEENDNVEPEPYTVENTSLVSSTVGKAWLFMYLIFIVVLKKLLKNLLYVVVILLCYCSRLILIHKYTLVLIIHSVLSSAYDFYSVVMTLSVIRHGSEYMGY